MKITRATSDENDVRKCKYGRKPWNDHQWIHIADELRLFAEDERSLFLDVFPLSWGYSPYRFKKKWSDENEYFAEALEYATGLINCRRNEMLTWNKDIVDRRDWLDKRPLYDKEYREYLKEKAEASKSDLIQGSGRIVVEYTKVPDSDIVKPLPESENG